MKSCTKDRLVSIIIPTYNYGQFLPETVQNLKEQSYTNWEAIIIDDGSTDDTENIVKQLISNDPRFHFIVQKNQGVAVARNYGLQLAKGEFIQFLDADDLLSKEKLNLQVQHLISHPQVDISYVINNYFLNNKPQDLFPDKELLGFEWMLRIDCMGVDCIKALVDRNIAVISSPLLRTSTLSKSSGFPEGVKRLEDWEFWLELAFNGAYYQFLPDQKAFTLIRVHPNSASFELREMQKSDILFRNKISKYIENSPLSKKDKKVIEKINRRKKNSLLKELIYKTPWRNKELLHEIKEISDPIPFYKYYIKSMNYHRKKLFKMLINK